MSTIDLKDFTLTIFDEDVKYTGDVEIKGFKPCGYGYYFRKNGDKFEGYFKKGYPVSGKYTYKNGSYVHVEYEYNLRHTKRTRYYCTNKPYGYPAYSYTVTHKSNGETYMGEFSNGKRNGIGKYVWNNGTSYIGGWKDGLFHGVGIVTYADGDYDWNVYENNKIISTLKKYRKKQYSSSSNSSESSYDYNYDYDYSSSSSDSYSSSSSTVDDMFDDTLREINYGNPSDALTKLNNLRSFCDSDDYYIEDEYGHRYNLDEYKDILEKEIEDEENEP